MQTYTIVEYVTRIEVNEGETGRIAEFIDLLDRVLLGIDIESFASYDEAVSIRVFEWQAVIFTKTAEQGTYVVQMLNNLVHLLEVANTEIWFTEETRAFDHIKRKD